MSIFREIFELSEDEREDFEERAAILEYDGQLSRYEAEKMALEIVKKKREKNNLHC
jgi:hypothetical protein